MEAESHGANANVQHGPKALSVVSCSKIIRVNVHLMSRCDCLANVAICRISSICKNTQSLT